jgi:hypothetical protein
MPNWCNNSVAIYHDDPAMIVRVREAFNKGALLQEFIPCPQDLTDTVSGSKGEDERADHEAQQAANREKYGYANWYDFCTGEWGTKWDVGSNDNPAQDIPDGLGLMLGFDSAWAPPIAAYEKLTEQGFRIRAMYYEPGMAFAGIWEDGADDYYELSGMSSGQVIDELPEELDEGFGISESMAEYEAENETE